MAIDESVAAEAKRLAEHAQKDTRAHLECAERAVVKWLCVERNNEQAKQALEAAKLIAQALDVVGR